MWGGSGEVTPDLEVVQHQFKGTGQRLLPLTVVGPNEFFFTVTYSPVGANVNGLGTYALHKDANEYLAYVNNHIGKSRCPGAVSETTMPSSNAKRALFWIAPKNKCSILINVGRFHDHPRFPMQIYEYYS